MRPDGVTAPLADIVPPRTLGRRDIVLFSVSAILLLETLTAAASVGPSAVTWWLLLGVVFFVPFAFVCAELGCTYPEQGGIYAWIRRAFGRRWGTRAAWAYWVNTAVWLPAIFILFAGIFAQLFRPGLSLPSQIGLGIALTWVAVAVNVVTLDIGKWVPNVGALLKVIVFAAVIGGAFAQSLAGTDPIAIDPASFVPTLDDSLRYIPAILYGLLGFELVSAGSNEMRNPARDVPQAIFISGGIILLLYVLATIALLIVSPGGDVDLVEGLVDALERFFGSIAGGSIVVLLGAAALFSFFSNGVTWALGCNRAAQQAALDGELPRLFALTTRHGTPLGAALSMGVIATALLLLYGYLAGSNEELFWSLFAFSAVIFMLPYLGMMLAFMRLRSGAGAPRGAYRAPLGALGAWLWPSICFALIALSILLFVYVPGDGWQWPVLVGAVVTLAVGEITIRVTEHRRR